jgi:hypothetical protein
MRIVHAANAKRKRDSATKALQPIDLQLDEREDGSPPALNTYRAGKVSLLPAGVPRHQHAYGHIASLDPCSSLASCSYPVLSSLATVPRLQAPSTCFVHQGWTASSCALFATGGRRPSTRHGQRDRRRDGAVGLVPRPRGGSDSYPGHASCWSVCIEYRHCFGSMARTCSLSFKACTAIAEGTVLSQLTTGLVTQGRSSRPLCSCRLVSGDRVDR